MNTIQTILDTEKKANQKLEEVRRKKEDKLEQARFQKQEDLNAYRNELAREWERELNEQEKEIDLIKQNGLKKQEEERVDIEETARANHDKTVNSLLKKVKKYDS